MTHCDFERAPPEDRRVWNERRLPELDEQPEDDPDVQEFLSDVRHVLERDDA
jgi:hypothetical protein